VPLVGRWLCVRCGPGVSEIFEVVGLSKVLCFYPTEEATRTDLGG
jgi:hypothetical protein